jgi:DNA-directed RNA polymerase subunit RPC12/RpoP
MKDLVSKRTEEDYKVRTEKIKETNLIKRGVDNPAKCPEIQEKMKATFIKNYGVDNPSKSKKVNDKKKETSFKNYGVDHPFKSKVQRKKIEETNILKYNGKTYIGGTAYQTKCYKETEKFLLDKGLALDTTFEEYFGINKARTSFMYKVTCTKCNTKFLFPNRSKFNDTESERCPTCNPVRGGQSKEEGGVFNFINSIYKGEILRNYRKIPYVKEIDILLPQLKIGFEYCGLYWHTEKLGKSEFYHQDKILLAQEAGIQLNQLYSYNLKNRKEDFFTFIEETISNTCKSINYSYEAETSYCRLYLDTNYITFYPSISFVLVEDTLLSFPRFIKLFDYLNNILKTKSITISALTIQFPIENCNTVSMNSIGFKNADLLSPNLCYTKGEKLIRPELDDHDELIAKGYDRIWDCGNRIFVKEYPTS